MKKILIIMPILVTFFCNECIAQYTAQRYMKWYDRMEKDDPVLYGKYKRAKMRFNIGIGLTSAGLAVAIAGVATGDIKVTKNDNYGKAENTNIGTIITIGLSALATGTPMLIEGLITKRKIKRNYLNEYGKKVCLPPDSPSPYWKIHSSAQGIGLSLMF